MCYQATCAACLRRLHCTNGVANLYGVRASMNIGGDHHSWTLQFRMLWFMTRWLNSLSSRTYFGKQSQEKAFKAHTRPRLSRVHGNRTENLPLFEELACRVGYQQPELTGQDGTEPPDNVLWRSQIWGNHWQGPCLETGLGCACNHIWVSRCLYEVRNSRDSCGDVGWFERKTQEMEGSLYVDWYFLPAVKY